MKFLRRKNVTLKYKHNVLQNSSCIEVLQIFFQAVLNMLNISYIIYALSSMCPIAATLLKRIHHRG